MTPVSASVSVPANPPVSSSPASGNDELASRDTFLRLLVAQLQNQDPLNPADPLQFVSQLAEFSSLEQSIAMRDHLGAIRESLRQTSTAGSAGPMS